MSFHGGNPQGDDKTMRSIFGKWHRPRLPPVCVLCMYVSLYLVANVGFDTTEEQLGTILQEVGPILNLK